MGDFFFIFKTFLATIVLIGFMQIKIGQNTLESYTYKVLAQSSLTVFLNDVAKGLIELGEKAKNSANDYIEKNR